MSTIAPPRPANAPATPSPHAPVTTPSRLLGRQPILDANRRLFGYEFLYRAGKTDRFSGDPDLATREVIDHWLLLIPNSPDNASFVNCTRSALTEGLVTLLPPASTVLEILEDIDPDPDVLSACLALRKQGYRFALDGFHADPSRLPFLHFADFVKIDFQTAGFELRREAYAMLAGSPARLLAEKIETDIQHRIAITEGCSLFQGYFFSQPVLIASHTVPQNSFVYLRLLSELHRNPTHFRKIEKLLSADASLCYRVLRLANSALQGHPGTISTLREALLMVGEDALRKLVTVAMTGALSAQRAPALLSMALSRAQFCELLAPSLAADPSQFCLLGLVSLLDVLLETSLQRVLETLPLAPAMKAALAGDGSPASLALDLVRALESCDWTLCDQIQHRLGLGEGAIAALYAQSLRWASSMLGESIAPPSR